MTTVKDYSPRKILVPVDMSELSDLALKYAHVGAKLFDAEIMVLNSMYFEYPRYLSAKLTDHLLKELDNAKIDARSRLAEHVSKVLGNDVNKVNIHYKAVDIDPAQAILQAYDEMEYDLIVMGTHGYSGFKHWMLGSVAEKVLHMSKVPVFTVRQKINGFIETKDPEAQPEINKILCPCNLTPSAAIALQTAASLAQRFDARLSVLYSSEAKTASEEERLKTWVEKTLQHDTSVETLIRHGETSDQIITAADQLESDLIIIGVCHRPIGKGTVVGRTSESVARHAPVPVLAVPYFM